MDKKEMKQMVKAEIKTGATVKDSVFKAVFNLEPDLNVLQLMAEINRAFKKAGLTSVRTNTALKDAKEFIADDMPTFTTYNGMVEYATDLQERFTINEDEDKGVKSALTAIRKHLKAEGEDVPKKSSFKPEAAHTINYMIEAGEEATLDGLQQYVSEEMGFDDSEMVQKALRIRLGTKFNPFYHTVNGITVDIDD